MLSQKKKNSKSQLKCIIHSKRAQRADVLALCARGLGSVPSTIWAPSTGQKIPLGTASISPQNKTLPKFQIAH